MHVNTMRAWPVKEKVIPTLFDFNNNSKLTVYKFVKKVGEVYTYNESDKKNLVNLQWTAKREVSRMNNRKLEGVLHQEMLLWQSEQDHHLWGKGKTKASNAPLNPVQKSKSPTPSTTLHSDTPDSTYFQSYLHQTCIVEDALKALDSLCLFVKADDKWCVLCSALPSVLSENKDFIRTKRNGYFESFVQCENYLEENKTERHMIVFWQNLYYQFGLIALELNASLLRPPYSMVWSKLCKTVSAYGFSNLYKDKNDFLSRYNMNLQTYRDHYNERHGTLRWFFDKYDNTNLHIDIINLTAIVTRYFVRDFEKTKDQVQHKLMNAVFVLQEGNVSQLKHVVGGLISATSKRNYQNCPQENRKKYKDEEDALYDVAFYWRWNTVDPNVYNNIYEEARTRSIIQKGKSVESMTYIMAVEHHRRYKQRKGPSIFWSASA